MDLNDEQVTRLFSLGYENTSEEILEDTDESRCDLLYKILVSPLPLNCQTVSSVPDVLKSLAPDLAAIAGKTIGQLLQEKDSSLSTLEKIKLYAKQKGSHTANEVTKDAYMVVYFAAIARAVTLYDVTMSQHKPSDLARFFATYEDCSWVLKELRELFAVANQDKLQQSSQ